MKRKKLEAVLQKEITEKTRFQEEIEYLSQYDYLTGLPNRALFTEKVMWEIGQIQNNDSSLSILFIDIDRFKNINVTLGHAVGDILLKTAAESLILCMKEGSICSRISGNLFCAMVTGHKNENYASEAAQNIIYAFNNSFFIEDKELFLSVNVGISNYPSDGQDVGTLMRNADTALYMAEEKGKNSWEFYKQSMHERAVEIMNLEMNLRRSLEKKELFLVYQPQIDLRTGKISGVEALIRWKHPTKGIISPAEFIPIAEETGIMAAIGEWVLKSACEQLSIWHKMGFRELNIAVNISAGQLDDPNLFNVVRKILLDSNLYAKYLILEITENILVQHKKRVIDLINELRNLGIGVAIDDFGTGFSSLSYLKKVPLDILKVDQSFVREICIDTKDSALTSTIINLAHSLKLEVVAEGVETKQQLELLKELNCDKIQGYYFSKPISPENFETMLKEGKVI